MYLPVAALSCILLGTGTSATQPAMATCARHNTTVLWTGAGGVRLYSASQPGDLSTSWLERQVRSWADDNTRLAVAGRMYEKRFDMAVPEGTTLNSLRGLEGQRMKTLYRTLAQRHKLRGFRRNYDPNNWDPTEPGQPSAVSSQHRAVRNGAQRDPRSEPFPVGFSLRG